MSKEVGALKFLVSSVVDVYVFCTSALCYPKTRRGQVCCLCSNVIIGSCKIMFDVLLQEVSCPVKKYPIAPDIRVVSVISFNSARKQRSMFRNKLKMENVCYSVSILRCC